MSYFTFSSIICW